MPDLSNLGYKAKFKIAEKIAPHLTDSAWQKIEDWNSYLDNESLSRYYKKVMKWEGCSYEKAIELCNTELNYRLGKKTCSPAIIEMLKMPDGSGIERFRKWLTPEEDELFMSDECPHTPEEFHIIWKKRYKREKRKQKIRGDKYR